MKTKIIAIVFFCLLFFCLLFFTTKVNEISLDGYTVKGYGDSVFSTTRMVVESPSSKEKFSLEELEKDLAYINYKAKSSDGGVYWGTGTITTNGVKVVYSIRGIGHACYIERVEVK